MQFRDLSQCGLTYLIVRMHDQGFYAIPRLKVFTRNLEIQSQSGEVYLQT